MKHLGPQDPLAEEKRDCLVLVQELVQEASVEMSRVRASTAALEALERNDWERIQRLAHNIAARSQALDLGVLASCAQELERFAGAIVNGDPKGQAVALQNAAIAMETVDLELSVLSNTERLA
jgi:HPt (histidine-containing phosphotransfer) domain-containing protein